MVAWLELCKIAGRYHLVLCRSQGIQTFLVCQIKEINLVHLDNLVTSLQLSTFVSRSSGVNLMDENPTLGIRLKIIIIGLM